MIDTGILRGYVTIHPKWAGFSVEDYIHASESIYTEEEKEQELNEEVCIEAEPGQFDYRGFEIVRTELLSDKGKSYVVVSPRELRFNIKCVRSFGRDCTIELLIHPMKHSLAVRLADQNNRSRITWSKQQAGNIYPKSIPTTAFGRTLYSLMGWDMNKQYQITGTFIEKGDDRLLLFQAANSRVIMNLDVGVEKEKDSIEGEGRNKTTKRVQAIPENWTHSFGEEFYRHEQAFAELREQTEANWQVRVKGQIYETGRPIHVTDYNILREYIMSIIGDLDLEGENDDG